MADERPVETPREGPPPGEPARAVLTMTPEGPLEGTGPPQIDLPRYGQQEPLDLSYARKQQALAWQEFEDEARREAPQPQTGELPPERMGAQPEQAREDLPTMVMGRGEVQPDPNALGPTKPPPPTPLEAGVQATIQSAVEAGRTVFEGLGKVVAPPSPERAKEGAGEAAFNQFTEMASGIGHAILGAWNALGVPFEGGLAAFKQAIENQAPGTLGMLGADPPTANFLRVMSGGEAKPGKSATIGEVIDNGAVVVSLFGPGAVAAGKKTARDIYKRMKEPGFAAEVKGALKGEGGGQDIPGVFGPGEQPPAESRLNVGRVNAPDSVKDLMTDLNQRVGGGELAQHREVVSHAQTVAEGAKVPLDVVLFADPAKVSIEEGRPVQQALRNYYNATATRLNEMVRHPELSDPEAAMNTWALALHLAATDERFGAGFARGLGARGITSEPSTPSAGTKRKRAAGGLTQDNVLWLAQELGVDPNQIRAQVEARAGGGTSEAAKTATVQGANMEAPKTGTPAEPLDTSVARIVIENVRQQLAQQQTPVSFETLSFMLNELTRPQQRSWFAQTMAGLRAGKDITFSTWIQAMLTGVKGHVSNMSSNAIGFMWEVPERFTAELVNLARQDPNGTAWGETARGLQSSAEAVQNAIRLMGKAWKEGEAPFEAAARERSKIRVMATDAEGKPLTTRFDEQYSTGKVGVRQISSADYGFDPTAEGLPGLVARSIDLAGSALASRYTPSAALMLEDALAKGIAYTMEIKALAHWQATREGLVGEAFDKRRAHLEQNPTPDLIVMAEDHAIQLTLNKELGPQGQLFVKGLDHVPGGRVLVPFVRWSSNAAKWFGQRAPILAQFSAENRRDLAAGGRARDRAIAREVLGASTGLAIGYLVAQGYITGDQMRKEDRKQRDFQEAPPNSIMVGDHALTGYSRWGGQVGQYISAVANFMEIVRHIPDQEWYNEWIATGYAFILAGGSVFVNQTAMQNLAQFIDGVRDPQSGGAKQLLGMARSTVPTVMGDITRAVDDNVIREVRSITDAFKARLPWTIDGIPAHRDRLTGEQMHYPVGLALDALPGGALASWMLPFGITTRKNDVVRKEIRDNQIDLAEVPRYTGGSKPTTEGVSMVEATPNEGVKLEPEERDYWIKAMTSVKMGGKTLYEKLDDLMAPDSAYWTWPTGQGGERSNRVKAIYNIYKREGLLMTEAQYPGLQAAIEARKQFRLDMRRPTTNPLSPQSPDYVPREPKVPRDAARERLIQGVGR